MNSETAEKINSFFKYLGINYDDLDSNDKLKILKDRKSELELDYLMCSILASNVNDIKNIEKYKRRMEADKIVIDEINTCIKDLELSIKKLNRDELKNLFKKGK